MSVGRFVTRVAAVGAPLMIPLMPKCPLCVLPLLTAAGLAAAPAPLLDGLAAIAAMAWVAIAIAASRSLPVRAFAVGAAMLLLGGRWLGFAWATWSGCALMLTVTFARRSTRGCERAACLRASPDEPPAQAGAG